MAVNNRLSELSITLQDCHRSAREQQLAGGIHCSPLSGQQHPAANLLPHNAAAQQPGILGVPITHCACTGEPTKLCSPKAYRRHKGSNWQELDAQTVGVAHIQDELHQNGNCFWGTVQSESAILGKGDGACIV